MTREEIKNLRECVDLIFDTCILADLRTKVHKRLEEVCDLAIKAMEQESVLDKIRGEIEQIEINGHIRDVECFRAGINTALNVINKYKAESEGV